MQSLFKNLKWERLDYDLKKPLNIKRFSLTVGVTLMGGKKKRSLKQMEKTQKKKTDKKGKSVAAPSSEKSIPGITTPNLKGDKVVSELKKMKVITPYSIASRFDLRLSIARDFLKELERNGMIEFVSRSRNLKIYKPVV